MFRGLSGVRQFGFLLAVGTFALLLLALGGFADQHCDGVAGKPFSTRPDGLAEVAETLAVTTPGVTYYAPLRRTLDVKRDEAGRCDHCQSA